MKDAFAPRRVSFGVCHYYLGPPPLWVFRVRAHGL